jgi:hypothetical protein
VLWCILFQRIVKHVLILKPKWFFAILIHFIKALKEKSKITITYVLNFFICTKLPSYKKIVLVQGHWITQNILHCDMPVVKINLKGLLSNPVIFLMSRVFFLCRVLVIYRCWLTLHVCEWYSFFGHGQILSSQ